FWKEQALDATMATQPLTVPTIWLQGLWDQEDMWGAIHSYSAIESKDSGNDKNFLIMGPWSHSQINRDGTALGPLRWSTDTTMDVRRAGRAPVRVHERHRQRLGGEVDRRLSRRGAEPARDERV